MNGISKKKLDGFEMNQYFTNCSIHYIPTDGRLMAINDKYLAMPWIPSGEINIVKSNNPGNLSYNNYGAHRYENSSILDMEFSPFNSNILAYSTDNNSVVMTSIKEDNNSYQFKSMSYKNHDRNVSFINFNPIASNVICSCTTHGDLHVWDTAKLKSFVEYNEVKSPNSISWSPNGSVIGISSKDKNFNMTQEITISLLQLE